MNPNRAFPGSPTDSYAGRMAHWMETQVISKVDAYLDLHGGDLIESLAPFSIVDRDDPSSIALARAFGLPLLVLGEPGGMTIGAGSRRGIPAVLAESGGQGLWPASAVEPLVDGVTRAMQFLGMLPGTVDQRDVSELRTFSWLRSDHAGAWRPRVHGGDRVRAGDVVGVVSDLLGHPLQTAVAEIDGVVLFSVSSLAMNVGDPLVGIGG
jgi:predicted deacylase